MPLAVPIKELLQNKLIKGHGLLFLCSRYRAEVLKSRNADIIIKNGYFTSFIHVIQKDALIDLKITNKTSTFDNVAQNWEITKILIL